MSEGSTRVRVQHGPDGDSNTQLTVDFPITIRVDDEKIYSSEDANATLTPEEREQGGKSIGNRFLPWEMQMESEREVYRKMFEHLTLPFRQANENLHRILGQKRTEIRTLRVKIDKQTAEQTHLNELYLSAFALAGGRGEDDLDSLPQLISRIRTLSQRARCGCVALDCRVHGSYIAADVELWERLQSPIPHP